MDKNYAKFSKTHHQPILITQYSFRFFKNFISSKSHLHVKKQNKTRNKNKKQKTKTHTHKPLGEATQSLNACNIQTYIFLNNTTKAKQKNKKLRIFKTQQA